MGNNKKIQTIMLAVELSEGLADEYKHDKKIAEFLIMNAGILELILEEELLCQSNI